VGWSELLKNLLFESLCGLVLCVRATISIRPNIRSTSVCIRSHMSSFGNGNSLRLSSGIPKESKRVAGG
jgi:hypothetical protein